MNQTNEDNVRFAREQLASGCDRMARLLHGLLDSKGRIAEEVHATRKLGKTLRGGLSLFRLGKTSTREIQVIGRLLSEPRDAVSRLSTWNKIGWSDDAAAAGAIHALLDQQTHSAARRPPPETVAWCVERVHVARGHLMALPAEDLAERVTHGLAKLDKRVLERCHRLDHHGKEDFHDARKALKAYLGAIEFMPPGLLTPDPILAALPELLGDENDLATLSEWLENHGFTQNFVPTLWEKLKITRDALRSHAVHEVSRLEPRRLG
ncbi:CHAD domain-containing protein [bacterium]|nr:CHAD domain-containing protein [bacterium]